MVVLIVDVAVIVIMLVCRPLVVEVFATFYPRLVSLCLWRCRVWRGSYHCSYVCGVLFWLGVIGMPLSLFVCWSVMSVR